MAEVADVPKVEDREEDRDDDDEEEEDLAKDPPPEHHRTQFAYTFWFNRRIQGARTQENYEKNIKRVGTFRSVEEFWSFYNHLIRPNDLPNTSDYHLFKRGIKPMWEDDANKSGGKWIVRLKKGLASRYWEDLLLAIVGGQFDVGEEICGIVISIRFQEDIISVWNRTATDIETKNRIHDTMQRVLVLPSSTVMEYKHHDASIRDNSSFRNTEHHHVPGGSGGGGGGARNTRERAQRGPAKDRDEHSKDKAKENDLASSSEDRASGSS